MSVVAMPLLRTLLNSSYSDIPVTFCYSIILFGVIAKLEAVYGL
jgi:hypothetical protein